MSKISDEQLRVAEIELEYYSKFMDWLYDNIINVRLTSDEINEIEKEQRNNRYPVELHKQKILQHFSLNNADYKPFTLGA